MNTVGINQLVQQSAKETLTNDGVMGKDDFLKMLTIQLKYQDPLDPMSNDQFASQLAQFSQLEALNNINDNITTEILVSQSMNNSFMVNMIGKDVMSYGDSVTLGPNGANIDFYLYGDANSVKVIVSDEHGKEIAVINQTGLRAGDRRVSWDGKTKEGDLAKQGSYNFRVEAYNKDGVLIPTETMNNGIVTGVTYEGGTPYLIVNGSYINLGDIVSVNMPEEED
jgi:flagellar basal-body rod modification protein FlgD